MTRTVIDAMAVAGGARLDGFSQAPAGFEGGKSVLGPLLMEEADEPPPGGSPISRALRHLGVVAAGSDEFDAVGLGRRRETEDWITAPNYGPPGYIDPI